MMEAVSTSETLADFYDITRRNIPEHTHLQYSRTYTKKVEIYTYD
jgi:hypothetical protein